MALWTLIQDDNYTLRKVVAGIGAWALSSGSYKTSLTGTR